MYPIFNAPSFFASYFQLWDICLFLPKFPPFKNYRGMDILGEMSFLKVISISLELLEENLQHLTEFTFLQLWYTATNYLLEQLFHFTLFSTVLENTHFPSNLIKMYNL